VVVRNAYPRPLAAPKIFASLVPSFQECVSPNRQHGPPLAHPSCAPPEQESSSLTVGRSFVASVRLTAIKGDPSNAVEDADVKFELSATDVLCAGTSAACPGGRGSDYDGRLLVRTTLRITDRDNDVVAGGGSDQATVSDVPLEVPAACTPTPSGQTGSTCDLTTTLDSVLPGIAKEGDRSIWQMGRIEVFDAGPNGTGFGSGCPTTCGDGDEAAFLQQGVFVP
jgi:hypothetical protein